jgi:hypothetical protein
MLGVVDMSTSRGHNFCIRSLFGAFYTLFERSIQGVHIFFIESTSSYMIGVLSPKKIHLGPQNGPESSGLKKP